jgi:uncharacterized protein
MLITQTSEIHRHQFAYAGFLHGYAIDHIYSTHGLFVVRYNDELAVLTKLYDHPVNCLCWHPPFFLQAKIVFLLKQIVMQQTIINIANEYKQQLTKLYGNELAELVLFGSYARGDFNKESDIDFAVVLRNPDVRPTSEIEKIAAVSSGISLKYGIMLSSLPVTLYKKQTSMQGIYQEIRKEGILI